MILVLKIVLLLWSISLVILYFDIRKQEIGKVMKLVWFLTVLYSGIFGLSVYYYSGRNQIREDTDFRRSFRSTSHCFSGCGLGEITGIIISSMIGFSILVTGLFTFVLAYLFGYIFNVIPLLKSGESLKVAVEDSFYTESLSIFVMEITAISIDILISGGLGILEPMFWLGLIISLIAGFISSYPINFALIKLGIKEGMESPNK